MNKNQNDETGMGLRGNENDQRPNDKNGENPTVSGQGSVRRSSVSESENGLEEKKHDLSPSSDNESISSDISGTGSAHSDIEEDNKSQNATTNVEMNNYFQIVITIKQKKSRNQRMRVIKVHSFLRWTL